MAKRTLSENILQAIDDFDDIQAAIIEKGVSVSKDTATSEYGNSIRKIKTNGGTISNKDVNFYDYDGTLLYSYTISEANALTSLPDGPVHDKLLFQEWNYSLVHVNATTIPINVGAIYTTKSEASEFDLTFTEITGLSTDMRIYNSTAGSIINIDWGDGTVEDATSTTIGTKTFTHTYSSMGSYTIKVDSIGNYYFWGGSGLPSNMFNISPNYTCTEVRLGDRCRYVDSYSFRNCYNLTSISIPSGATLIGQNAFYQCYSLITISIPNNVTSINASTFRQCYSLTTVLMPSNITSIAENAFYQCYNLTNILIPANVITIGNYAFYQCYSLSNISIPNGITSISNYIFQQCYNLSSVSLPNTITTIGNYAFQYCYSLTSISIPDNITSIGSSAFYQCYTLASMSIPSGVTSIGGSAFYQCYIIKNYLIKATEPPTLSTNAFDGINDGCIIYVPPGTLKDYQSATNWTAYASYMREWE